MNISRIIGGVAALTFLTGVAFAEPPKLPHDSKATTTVASAPFAQTANQSNDSKPIAKKALTLSDKQMDTVSAGMVYSIDGVCCYTFSQVPWHFVAKVQIYQ